MYAVMCMLNNKSSSSYFWFLIIGTFLLPALPPGTTVKVGTTGKPGYTVVPTENKTGEHLPGVQTEGSSGIIAVITAVSVAVVLIIVFIVSRIREILLYMSISQMTPVGTFISDMCTPQRRDNNCPDFYIYILD